MTTKTKPTDATTDQIERRYLAEPRIELREAEGQRPRVRGYAAVFGRKSEPMWRFVEVIEAGAFDDVLGDDVRALFNHDGLPLARTKSGTLQIGVDQTGLWYDFETPDSTGGNDLVVAIRRGDVDQSSFSFTVSKEQWDRRDENDAKSVDVRHIMKVKRLYDVSPVTFPAYPDTSVAVRSLERARAADASLSRSRRARELELAEAANRT
ncbi:MAG: HK97 family phage prohead protease [Pseudomonadota bacterium]